MQTSDREHELIDRSKGKVSVNFSVNNGHEKGQKQGRD